MVEGDRIEIDPVVGALFLLFGILILLVKDLLQVVAGLALVVLGISLLFHAFGPDNFYHSRV